MRLSTDFIIAVKIHSKKKVWEIAREAGIHPSTLSRWLSGAELVRTEDPRLKKVCDVIGFSVQDTMAEAGK